jgi:hypothetical protein
MVAAAAVTGGRHCLEGTMAVLLKDFDPPYKSSAEMVTKAVRRIDLERARPTVWTAKQLEDLESIINAIAYLHRAVGEMAARVRDD